MCIYVYKSGIKHLLYIEFHHDPSPLCHSVSKTKKSEAATQAAILANPLSLLATPSGLGPQQSVYDYFGVAVPWVDSDRIHGIFFDGIFSGSREHSDQWLFHLYTYIYCKWEIGL